VTVEGFDVLRGGVIAIRGNTANPASVRLVGNAEANPSQYIAAHGVYVWNTQNVNVEGVTIENFSSVGIFYEHGARGSVTDTVSQNNYFHGLLAQRHSYVFCTRLKAFGNGVASTNSQGQASPGTGIHSHILSYVWCDDCTSGGPGQGNGIGYHAAWHSYLGLNSSRASHNLYDGALAQLTSEMHIYDNLGLGSSFSQNQRHGVYIHRNAEGNAVDTVVANNGSHGVVVSWGSTLVAGAVTGSGNQGWGTYVSYQALAVGLLNSPSGVSGNALADTNSNGKVL
jgi:hypothetical protein